MATEKSPKRRNTDWDAVHRDYRTGKFTIRELAAKYGVSHQAVAKQAKSGNWQKDLTQEIKDATNALVVRDLVNQEVAKSGQEVANTVLAAAEINAQVIMGHRKELATARATLEEARAKVAALGDTVADIREAKIYMDAASTNVTAAKVLIELERKIHGLDEQDAKSESEFEDFLRIVRSRESAAP